MVVAATDFYKALSDPLQAIQDIYDVEGDKGKFTATVRTHFESLFQDTASRAKIAPLTRSVLQKEPLAESGPSTQTARLVRWRCMIQDTSMGNELMPRRFKSSDGRWKNGLFGAASFDDEQIDGEPDISPNQLGSLTTLFGVSLPGQARWSELADETLDTSLEGELSSRFAKAALRADTTGTAGIKLKLPTGSEIGVLLKVYDEDLAESVRVAQAVDLIGILDQSTLPSAEWSSLDGGDAAGGATLHPALHVITMQKADMHLGDVVEGKEADIRSSLINYLATALQGDRVAAEWLLLSLIARIHTHTASRILGPLSLNISSYQADAQSPALYALLSDILPLVVQQSLDLTHLNDKDTIFAPKSRADESGLQAGRLQLVDGTLVLIDENSMQEGQLKETGIENIRSLSSLMTSRKLSYAFPYSNLEMDSDISMVILSQGKSFLPVDVQIPLQPQGAQACPDSDKDNYGVLDYRHYLAAVQWQSAQAKQFTISNEMSDKIQSDFVQSRSGKRDVKSRANVMESQEDLSRTIHVARLLCLSKGSRSLTWQDWQGAKLLEAERAKRLLQ